MPLLYIPLSCLFLWDNKLWPLFHFKRFIFSTEVEGTYKVLIFTLYTKTVIQKTFPHFSCSSLSCRQCQVEHVEHAEVNRLLYSQHCSNSTTIKCFMCRLYSLVIHFLYCVYEYTFFTFMNWSTQKGFARIIWAPRWKHNFSLYVFSPSVSQKK